MYQYGNPYPQSMYNPMMNAQQRLNMMEQQYPQFAQQNPQQVTPVLKGRPVSSYEEANAAMIDLDGSVFYFLDQPHGKIYTKQINLDGTATLNTYSLTEQNGRPLAAMAQPTPAQTQNIGPQDAQTSVSRSELDQVVNNLTDRINGLERKILEGNGNDNKSDSNDGGTQRKK